MNRIRLFSQSKYLALAVLAACFLAGRANAQVFQGKFSLPSETRWGGATLPAGEYSFWLESTTINGVVHLSRGPRYVALVLPQSQEVNYSQRAELTIVQGAVRTLNLPQIGVVLRYPRPQRKHLTAPEERQLARMIPVASAGK